MRLHRSLIAAAMALLTAFALAQTTPPPTTAPQSSTEKLMTKEQKDEVLKSLADIIDNRAFVPGVDRTRAGRRGPRCARRSPMTAMLKIPG